VCPAWPSRPPLLRALPRRRWRRPRNRSRLRHVGIIVLAIAHSTIIQCAHNTHPGPAIAHHAHLRRRAEPVRSWGAACRDRRSESRRRVRDCPCGNPGRARVRTDRARERRLYCFGAVPVQHSGSGREYCPALPVPEAGGSVVCV